MLIDNISVRLLILDTTFFRRQNPVFKFSHVISAPFVDRLNRGDYSALRERQGLSREDGAHGVKHAKALLARGVQIGADGAEILRTRQGTKAA